MKKILVLAALVSGLIPFTGRVAAQTWNQTLAPRTNWQAIASSADGSKLVAVVYWDGGTGGGPIYTSANAGTNWTLTSAPIHSWDAVASSADGTELIAASGFNDTGPVCTSSDSGVTWVTNNDLPFASWASVACSANGSVLIAAQQNGPIYISTNSGATWADSGAPSDLWFALAASADGSKLVAADYWSSIFISPDGGQSWNPVPNITGGDWRAAACSADGQKIAVVAAYGSTSGAGPILTSTNGGATWASNSLSGYWNFVTCSADGTRLAVAGGQNDSSGMWTSTNFGKTWISNSVPFYTSVGLAGSADGGRLAAVVQGGNIYTAQTVVPPKLNIVRAGTNATISWFVPSSPFQLQRNKDLNTANWAVPTDATVVFNPAALQMQATGSPTNSYRFFRLKSQ
jgi:hypothetical protein